MRPIAAAALASFLFTGTAFALDPYPNHPEVEEGPTVYPLATNGPVVHRSTEGTATVSPGHVTVAPLPSPRHGAVGARPPLADPVHPVEPPAPREGPHPYEVHPLPPRDAEPAGWVDHCDDLTKWFTDWRSDTRMRAYLAVNCGF